MYGSRRTRTRWRRVWLAPAALLTILASVSTSGCGPELDEISVIEGVRIIGLRQSAPYARPGEEVTLHMLWEDGSLEPPRDVQTFFAFWCVNPPGDLFSECLQQVPEAPPQVTFGGTRASIVLPEDSLRPSSVDPRLPATGVAYVFYGACAGTLRFAGAELGPDAAGGAGGAGVEGQAGAAANWPDFSEDFVGSDLLPSCVDAQGRDLGADDFVIGYSSIFIYEDLRNSHPVVSGFRVAGEDV